MPESQSGLTALAPFYVSSEICHNYQLIGRFGDSD